MTTDWKSLFAATEMEAWHAQLEQDLKGKTFADLIWETPEGIKVAPFYTRSELGDIPEIPLDKEKNEWLIQEIIRFTEPKETNRLILQALEGGTEAIQLVFDAPIVEHIFREVMNGVFIEMIRISFTGQWVWRNSMKMYEMWLRLLQDRSVSPSETNVLISASPLDTDNLKLLLAATKDYPTCYITEVYAVKNAVEQLRDIINSLHYLRKTHGEEIIKKVQVNMPVGNSFFMEIAKLRAFRLLWAREISAEVLPYLHTFTSPMSLGDDINQNKIQATTQCLAGIIGNADLVTVTPSDARTGEISDMSRRIARNVQHLLRLEGQLDKVADAGAGSYYIEKITAELVAAAQVGA